jgi:hypothetical protein
LRLLCLLCLLCLLVRATQREPRASRCCCLLVLHPQTSIRGTAHQHTTGIIRPVHELGQALLLHQLLRTLALADLALLLRSLLLLLL